MRRIDACETYGGEVGDTGRLCPDAAPDHGRYDIPVRIIRERDYRLMLAVVRAAEMPLRLAAKGQVIAPGMMQGLAEAYLAFNVKAGKP